MIRATDEMRRAFAVDGAIKTEGLFTPAELAECRRCFEFNLANPGPTALELYKGTRDAQYNDLGTEKTRDFYRDLYRDDFFLQLR